MDTGLKIGFLVAIVIVLVIGFSVFGGSRGGDDLQEDEPFSVTILNSISSFVDGFSRTDAAAPVSVISKSSVREVGPFQPNDPIYYQPDLPVTPRPVTAEEAEKKLIMDQNINFLYTARSFEVNVADGPMVITYCINKREDTSIACFMEMTVTDCTTGEVLLEDGYRRKYGAELKKEFTIFQEGPMRIDLYGNKVNANIRVYADR